MVKLRNVDLNLLVILDALLDEAHVGRAAARLGLSQPAASNALARARNLFDDPLLVRASAKGLQRTPRANLIREPLRLALADLSIIVEANPPPVAELQGAVRLVVSDIPAIALGARITRELARLAPGIDLIFHPWHVGDEVQRLTRGEIDLAVAVAPASGVSFRSEWLGEIPYSVLMRREHPSASDETLDIDRWLASPHVVVSGHGGKRGSVDSALGKIGRERRVAIVVPTLLMALELLCETDLMATFPKAAMTSTIGMRLTTRPPPVALEPVSLYLVSHHRSTDDPAVKLVADLVHRFAQELF
ncbi:LysR family transcriptional regulator [Rhizobium sp. NFR03]|uniref:LysR family transcriptional regulator n=1 Tax=Rhizobium sp. NFR03 TaxID=1566263 RepID=UPI0008C7C10A|nr:LysR family transcriptional regulator [Rhizobium sp. NFR03]SES46842.1 DNA-binding transcriptional regulator, LysR family [Rhizobium sp. NFR03]